MNKLKELETKLSDWPVEFDEGSLDEYLSLVKLQGITQDQLVIPLDWWDIFGAVRGDRDRFSGYMEILYSHGIYPIKDYVNFRKDPDITKKAIELGLVDDPSDSARRLYYYYSENHDLDTITEWIKSVIANDTRGCPSTAACDFLMQGLVSVDWVKSIVEKAVSGDPCHAAVSIVMSDRSNLAWAIDFINNSKIGERAKPAELMSSLFGYDTNWAKSVIESADYDDKSSAAYALTSKNNLDKSWLIEIIENDYFGDIGKAASLLYKNGSVTKEWADGIIKRAKTLQLSDVDIWNTNK